MALSPNPTEAELLKLIDDQVSEGKEIDYKLSISVNTDEDKKEFLADISSFANTVGGHYVIGMEEDKGLPISLEGISISDPDQMKLRLEGMIKDGLSPRIPGVSIREPILLQNGNYAIVIHVPKSLAAPHMVSYKNTSRFWARNSAGKYQLDVQELRQAFLQSGSIEQRIRDFRINRIAMIGAGETPVEMPSHPKIVLHAVPVSAVHIEQIYDGSNDRGMWLLRTTGLDNHRYNLDGVLFFNTRANGKSSECIQVFRNGCIEYINADLLEPSNLVPGYKGVLPTFDFELKVVEQTYSMFDYQRRKGIEPPIYLFITLLGVRGMLMGANSRMSAYQNIPFDRDLVMVPEVYIEDHAFDTSRIAQLLKPAFDAVWNAAGWPHSVNFDEQGNWKLQLNL